MREIIKQCIMVEDHLFQRQKRCPDCIRKHMLTIEGLAEECATLCQAQNAKVASDADTVATTARVLHHAWEQKPRDVRVCRAVAADVRAMRKELMKKYAALPLDKLPHEEVARVRALVRTR